MSHFHFLTEGEFEGALRRLDVRMEASSEGGARRHGRRMAQMDVVLRDEQGWGPIRLSSIDISPTGVLVDGDLALMHGAGYLLEFKAPRSGRPVRVWGRVVRATGDNEERPGIAFEFLDLPEHAWDDLCHFVGRGR